MFFWKPLLLSDLIPLEKHVDERKQQHGIDSRQRSEGRIKAYTLSERESVEADVECKDWEFR